MLLNDIYHDGDLVKGNIINKKRYRVDSYGWHAYLWKGKAWVVRHQYPCSFLDDRRRKCVPMNRMIEMLEVVGIIPIGSVMGAEPHFLDKLVYFPKADIKDLVIFETGPTMFDDNYEFRPLVYTPSP